MTRIQYTITTLLLFIGVGLSSCEKWLDVKPEDKFTEGQVFANETSINQVLNGLYIKMGDANLYGNHLGGGTVDILAQLHNIGTTHSWRKTWEYAYTDSTVQAVFSSMWSTAYASITNANELIRNLDAYREKKTVRPLVDSLMRGEAIAVRALLHFDMLRVFGPIMATADSLKPSIPYYSSVSTQISPLYPANAVMDSIIKDLATAEALLQNDPVRTLGSQGGLTGDNTNFWINRNQRLNYFAVKGLQARANLYRGDKPAALASALTVINGAETFFPWVVPNTVISDKDNPNRVMTTECLFMLYNPNLYKTYQNLFAPELADNNILAPNDTRLKGCYESNENDYRYNPSWFFSNISSKNYKTFYKYADIVDKNKPHRFLQPMVRKSELYLIAAECEPDKTTALQYLNTLRKNRGLTDLASTVTVITEVQKEYQKEFYGEGQMFFHYKRRNVASILNSTSTTTASIAMNAAKYVVPLPISETTYR